MINFHVIIMARIVDRAERDHKAGIPLSACTYNPGSEALKTHTAVYARLDGITHSAPAADRRVDHAQGVAEC